MQQDGRCYEILFWLKTMYELTKVNKLGGEDSVTSR